MYVCVCTVARGSSGNEILFPCQIKASAPIKCYSELWSLLTWCTGFLRTEENRRDGGQEDMWGWTLTSVLAFTTKVTKWALTVLSHVQSSHTNARTHCVSYIRWIAWQTWEKSMAVGSMFASQGTRAALHVDGVVFAMCPSQVPSSCWISATSQRRRRKDREEMRIERREKGEF